jgi:hypothetical protein
MRRMTSRRVVTGLLVALAATPTHAHATYNVSGYGAGLAGSTNGSDGAPTAVPPAEWTNGPPEG